MVAFCKRESWIFYVLLCLNTGFAAAQQKNYHLPELEQAAKSYLPGLLAKQALVNSSRASVTAVRHSFLPQVKLNDQVNLGTDNSLAGSYLPMGINPSSSGGIRADNNYQPVTGNIGVVYGEYELLNFGLNKAKLQNAFAYTELQQADLEKTLYDVQAGIARTYFNLLKTSYRLAADEQNVNRYDSIFTVIRALASSGIKPGSDSSLSRAELSKARITYNQTLAQLNQLKQTLAYLTGIPAAKLEIDSPANGFSGQHPPVLNLADTSGKATNPLINYTIKRNNILLAEEKLIRKTYLPRLSLAAAGWMRGSGIQYNDNFKSLGAGLGYQRFNYMTGISLTYNLLSGLYKKDRLAINRFQLEAGNDELQQNRLSLDLAAAQAAELLQTNEASLRELPVQLEAASQTYRQKLAQYRAGIISLIDVTNASFVLYRSQTDYIETRNDWYLAQLDQAVATGNLLSFIQQIK